MNAGIAPDDIDLVLPDPVVMALAQRHVPSAQSVTFVDESGRKGRAYFIDNDIVLKTHRPSRLRPRIVEEFETSLEKDAFFLGQMDGNAGIRTPKLFGYGREGKIEYVCMSRVHGISMRRADLTTQQRQAVLRDLGRTLRRIHSLPQAPFNASGLFPEDGSSEQLRKQLEAMFRKIVEAMLELPDEWRIRLPPEQIAVKALAALPVTAERAALHSNPAGEHIFVDPESRTFVGLIDFGDAYIGHPAFDLRPWRDPLDRAALIAGYDDEGAIDDHFLAMWRVGLILGELAALLRRREPPARSEENLRLLLAEL